MGYSVETIRVTTQPLAELVAGLSEDQALAFLGQLDQLAAKEGFHSQRRPSTWNVTSDPFGELITRFR